MTVYDPSLLSAKSDCVVIKQCVTRCTMARQRGTGWSESPPTRKPYSAIGFFILSELFVSNMKFPP